MSTAIGIATVWLLSGLMTAYLMARSGHRHSLWLLICLLLGPLGIPILRERAETEVRPLVAHRQPGDPDAGLRVLVALDGSPESDTAFDSALRVLGPQMQTVFLVTVLDYDAGDDVEQSAVAEARLVECAQRCSAASVSYAVLAGRPASALLEFAEDRDVDVIVAGRRGRGLTTWLLGSVVSTLLRSSTVPVLVGGYEPLEADDRASDRAASRLR